MIEPRVTHANTSPSLARPAAAENRSIVGSLTVVVGFWWAATGLTAAMQHGDTARQVTIVVTTLLAIVGFEAVRRSRDATTVHAARTAFLGSALLWWWVAALFYAGVGFTPVGALAGESGTLALALQAINATLRPDLVGVGVLVAVALMVRRSRNRLALSTLFTFWATLQTAKLNVFFGVRNAGLDWLPDRLASLAGFFGPPRNSPLLPITVVVLSVLFALVVERARRERLDYARHANAMLASLVGLAVIEHVLLGLPMSLPLWNAFLARN